MASNHEEVKLIGMVGSPFVARVEIALNLKGVEYKFEEEKWGNFSDAVTKYNPIYKKVPVLVHNDKPILESLVIIEYIDEVWKQNPILPSDPYKRVLARFWAKFTDESFGALQKFIFSHDEKERKKYNEEIEAAFEILENELKDKFFGGEEIGLVDITGVYIAFFVPIVQEVIGLNLLTSEKFPKLYKWSQDFNSHQVIKQTLPNRESQLAKFKAFYESLGASK